MKTREELEDLAVRLEKLPLADQLVVASELLRAGGGSRVGLAITIINRVGGLLGLAKERGSR